MTIDKYGRETKHDTAAKVLAFALGKTMLERLAAKYDPLPPAPAQPPSGAAKWQEQAEERKLGL